ncbi:hypothetical protein ACA910_018915 [Epithemia clementina (nom. ined.)]
MNRLRGPRFTKSKARRWSPSPTHYRRQPQTSSSSSSSNSRKSNEGRDVERLSYNTTHDHERDSFGFKVPATTTTTTTSSTIPSSITTTKHSGTIQDMKKSNVERFHEAPDYSQREILGSQTIIGTSLLGNKNTGLTTANTESMRVSKKKMAAPATTTFDSEGFYNKKEMAASVTTNFDFEGFSNKKKEMAAVVATCSQQVDIEMLGEACEVQSVPCDKPRSDDESIQTAATQDAEGSASDEGASGKEDEEVASTFVDEGTSKRREEDLQQENAGKVDIVIADLQYDAVEVQSVNCSKDDGDDDDDGTIKTVSTTARNAEKLEECPAFEASSSSSEGRALVDILVQQDTVEVMSVHCENDDDDDDSDDDDGSIETMSTMHAADSIIDVKPVHNATLDTEQRLPSRGPPSRMNTSDSSKNSILKSFESKNSILQSSNESSVDGTTKRSFTFRAAGVQPTKEPKTPSNSKPRLTKTFANSGYGMPHQSIQHFTNLNSTNPVADTKRAGAISKTVTPRMIAMEVGLILPKNAKTNKMTLDAGAKRRYSWTTKNSLRRKGYQPLHHQENECVEEPESKMFRTAASHHSKYRQRPVLQDATKPTVVQREQQQCSDSKTTLKSQDERPTNRPPDDSPPPENTPKVDDKEKVMVVASLIKPDSVSEVSIKKTEEPVKIKPDSVSEVSIKKTEEPVKKENVSRRVRRLLRVAERRPSRRLAVDEQHDDDGKKNNKNNKQEAQEKDLTELLSFEFSKSEDSADNAAARTGAAKSRRGKSEHSLSSSHNSMVDRMVRGVWLTAAADCMGGVGAGGAAAAAGGGGDTEEYLHDHSSCALADDSKAETTDDDDDDEEDDDDDEESTVSDYASLPQSISFPCKKPSKWNQVLHRSSSSGHCGRVAAAAVVER